MSEGRERKKPKHRSPAYPSLPLEAAIAKAEVIYRCEKRAAAPVAVVTQHCGLDIKNSNGLRLISALKQYGLVTEEGSLEDRQVKLSSRALDIILSESDDSPERIKAIEAAALSPPIHKKILEKYDGSLPSAANLKSYLLRELDFNDLHVDRFIKTFFATMGFAKVMQGDIMDEGQADTDDVHHEWLGRVPGPGDYVQWSPGGLARFPAPRRVLGVSSDWEFAFLEGIEEGLPMSELTVQGPPILPAVTKPAPSTTTTTPAPHNPYFESATAEPCGSETAREQKKFDEGTATLTWPDNLSKDSVEDLEYWLEGVIRRAKRKAGLLPPSQPRERLKPDAKLEG
jgi:hypothetical protein